MSAPPNGAYPAPVAARRKLPRPLHGALLQLLAAVVAVISYLLVFGTGTYAYFQLGGENSLGALLVLFAAICGGFGGYVIGWRVRSGGGDAS